MLLSSCYHVNRLIKPGVYKPLEILEDDTSKTFDDFTLTVQEITEEEYIQRRRVNVFEDPYTQERSDEAPRYLTLIYQSLMTKLKKLSLLKSLNYISNQVNGRKDGRSLK